MRLWARRWVQHPWFESIIGLLILFSLFLLIPEVSLPLDHPWMKPVERMQAGLTVLFAGELAIRFLAARRKLRFLGECWPDILALIPMFRVARFLRLLRLLRLYRLLGVASRSSLMRHRLLRRAPDYALVGLTLSFFILVGCLGLTLFEAPNRGLPPLLHHLWVSIFTLAQVEYASELPLSLGGKLVLLGIELCGLTLFAVLSATASALLVNKLREGIWLPVQLEELEDHVIVCGWNSGLEATLRQLQRHPEFAARDFVVVADRKDLPELLDLPIRHRVRLVRDDFTRIEVLERCNVARASVALIVSDVAHGRSRQDADARTVLAALTIEKLNPSVYTCAELSNAMNESHLRMGNVNEVVITQDLAGHLLAQAAVSPVSWRALHELVQPHHPEQGLKTFEPDPQWLGQPFDECVVQALASKGVLLVGLQSSDEGLMLNPRGRRVQSGDLLVGIPPQNPVQ